MTYQTLQNLLQTKFLNINGHFNAKKPMCADAQDSIRYHTGFLDYDASMNVRASYILKNQLTQVQCLECKKPLQIIQPLGRASEFCGGSCSKKSARTQQKRKTTTELRYGVSNIFQRTDIIEKAVFDKYGVTNVSYLDATKEKIGKKSKSNTKSRLQKTSETNLARYGTAHTSSLVPVKEKKKETYLNHYGETHYFKTTEFKENMLLHFDGKNPAQLAEVKAKSKNSKKFRYGDEYYNNRPKAARSMIERYGCHSSQQHWSEEAKDIMKNPESMSTALKNNTINAVAEKFNLAPTTVRNKAYEMGIVDYDKRENQYESLICELLTRQNISFERNNRSILNGKELDIYVPSMNIAIECNGIFWHSELMGKNKDYHISKSMLCSSKGIRLIHLWDYQFDKNPKLVLQLISAKLGIFDVRVGARNTSVKPITSSEFTSFMDLNHLQGAVNAKFKYGLFINNELISAMGFGNSRFKQGECELLRFATRSGCQVIGGASKLFTYFLNQCPEINQIVSYAEKDISDGRLYEKLGFSLISVSPPAYLYFDNRKVYNRIKFQKHKLEKQLEVFDQSKTEWENMKINGFNRFWTTGAFKYEFTR